jgi:hypothetical protein
VPHLDPAPRLVEGREGDKEFGEGVVLSVEEVGEAEGLFTRGRHETQSLV